MNELLISVMTEMLLLAARSMIESGLTREQTNIQLAVFTPMIDKWRAETLAWLVEQQDVEATTMH